MKSFLWIALLATLLAGTRAQDGFDLSDALGDDVTPTLAPKAPTPEPKKPAVVPPKDGETDPAAPPPPPPPPPPSPPMPAGDGFDLMDAFGPDPEPGKPAVVPPKDGGTGGGGFGDDDLLELSKDFKPDPGTGGRKSDSGGSSDTEDSVDNSDQPQEAGSGQIAGIASAIGVAILGAASSYFAYQKKKLCFKIQGGVDPESGKGVQSDPQVMSNLLKSSS